MANSPTGLAALKERQQKTWSTGDFATIAIPLMFTSELLCEAVDPSAGQSVLDVACGSGNTAIAAARRNCRVTGIDYVPALIDRAKERAAAERLEIDFRVGDAEQLEFPDASFDLVLSSFGVMFAPDQEKAATELLRVCKPGGRIGMANWTPAGHIGRMFRTVAQHIPPPSGAPMPLRWGSEEGLNQLFPGGVRDIVITRRVFVQRYPDAEAWLAHFRSYFGPIATAFAQLDEAGGQALARDLLELMRRDNIATDGTLKTAGEYLEIIITKG